MYKITEQNYGMLLTFSGFIDMDELADWYRDSELLLQMKTEPFGVIIDLRTISPLSVETRETFRKGQELYLKKGMHRSVVIFTNAVALMQFKQMAKVSGIYQWERYIDAGLCRDWLKCALMWINNGINPVNCCSDTGNDDS